jgi:signal transduction histidine kinase
MRILGYWHVRKHLKGKVTVADQSQNTFAHSSVEVGRLTDTIAKNILYLTIACGYLLTIIASPNLMVLNFFLFTVLTCCYCVIVWRLLKNHVRSLRQIIFSIGGLTVLTILSGLLSLYGLYWDWLIYIITVVVYMIYLPLRSAIIACILLWLLAWANVYLLDNMNWQHSSIDAITLLPAFCLASAFMYVFGLLNAQRERAEELLHKLEVSNAELEQAHVQLRSYADKIEEFTIVRERTRLAREIHDSLGHYLSILNIQLETMSKLQERDPARLATEIAEARRVAGQSMQEVRNAVAALRPTSIATLSLPEALTQLGHEFERHAEETELTLDLDSELPSLSLDLQTALYRAAQEALTNVRKHAQASKVLIRLRYEGELLELVIRDNGEGSSHSKTDKQSGGFGLIGLRERIELLGGQIQFGPFEPSGYRVAIQVKIPSASIPTSLTDTLNGDEAHPIQEGAL